jgi:hypothetical protein
VKRMALPPRGFGNFGILKGQFYEKRGSFPGVLWTLIRPRRCALASSEARNTTALAISSGVPIVPMEERAAKASCWICASLTKSSPQARSAAPRKLSGCFMSRPFVTGCFESCSRPLFAKDANVFRLSEGERGHDG